MLHKVGPEALPMGLSHELRHRNSNVTVAQVPTCSKFTATKLANYSKIVFALYQLWCKIYLKYRSCLRSYQEIQI